jgi:hypothetical protein
MKMDQLHCLVSLDRYYVIVMICIGISHFSKSMFEFLTNLFLFSYTENSITQRSIFRGMVCFSSFKSFFLD